MAAYTTKFEELTAVEQEEVRAWACWRGKDQPVEPMPAFAARMKDYRFGRWEGKISAENPVKLREFNRAKRAVR